MWFRTESAATLAEIAKLLATEPKLRLLVVGHTDSVGTYEANLDLSAILNAAETPEGKEFARIAAEKGLKAALAWRDGRYGELA